MRMLWLVLICYLPVYAQESFEVNYLIRFNDNLSNKDPQFRRHHGILRIEGGNSYFFMAAIDKHPNSTPDLSKVLDTTFYVKTNPSKNELYALDFSWDRGFLWVTDSLFPMEWTIDTATKKVGELNCTKATCYFRGRNYTAWYSTDIPIAFGPWKMGGLPGLIIELEDENQNLVVRFSKMSIGTTPFKLPIAKVEWKDFVKIRKKAEADYIASMKADQKANCLTCQTELSIKMGESLEKY